MCTIAVCALQLATHMRHSETLNQVVLHVVGIAFPFYSVINAFMGETLLLA